MRRHIELIARGVLVRDGHLLLCHSKGAKNTYLPGGHIEFGESACEALAREIEEELGRPATIGRFLGGVEHTFVQKGKRHCEVNLVFAMRMTGVKPPRRPRSKEKKIDFRWLPIEQLPDSRLEPRPLRALLGDWLEVRTSRWASTFRSPHQTSSRT